MEALFCKQIPVKPTNSLPGGVSSQGSKEISQTDGNGGNKKKDAVSYTVLK